MTRSLPIRSALSTLVLFAPLLAGRVAFAQEACGDTNCPKGFSCETEAGACPAIDCVEGPCQPCVPQMVSVCRPGPCSVDSDCADGMACAAVEQTNCTGAAEPACTDGSCPDLPSKDASCTTTTSKQCLPRWALPCAADADCGAGFNCKEQQQCSTSGSSGGATPGSSGSGSSGSSGAADPAPAPTPSTPSEPPVTTCEPSGIKACEPVRVACTADAQCPSGWSCRDNPEGTCWADSNGNSGCTPADPAKLCFPPYVDLLNGGGLGANPTVDGSGVPTTSSKGESAGATPVEAGGGCSIVSAPTASRSALAWCLALGAALGLSRRARRRR